jgi:hypothetical protein
MFLNNDPDLNFSSQSSAHVQRFLLARRLFPLRRVQLASGKLLHLSFSVLKRASFVSIMLQKASVTK